MKHFSFILLYIMIAYIFSCKTELYRGFVNNRGRESFSEIDRHALGAGPSDEESVASLSRYLSAKAGNDVDKARAIYRWITDRISFDLNSYFSGGRADSSPGAVLKTRIASSDGYVNLFSALASEMGLESGNIRGFSKGFGYLPGKKLNHEDHIWNVIKINNSWGFIDTTWGAGYIKGKDFVRDFSDHFFLTPPDQFITDHFPGESAWQLLEPPISRERFMETPRLFPFFFGLGFSNLNPNLNTLDANDYQEVSLETSEPVLLTGSLDKSKEHIFIRRDGKRITIEIRSPGAGSYIFKLYGKSPINPNPIYPLLLEQKINFQKANASPNYPEVPDFTKIQILSPKTGNLKVGTINFSFVVPNAREIAISEPGKEWRKFLSLGGSTFAGEIKITEGPISVLANYGETSWPVIARYNVVQ